MPVQWCCNTARFIVCIVFAGAAASVSGCRKSDQIEERTEPIPRHETAYVEPEVDVKTAVLAGIGPLGREGDRWCFFKMSGPADKVAKERERFNEFIGSLVYRPEFEIPFAWTLPPEWRELPGSGFRLATIRTSPLPTESIPAVFDDPAFQIAWSAFQVGYEAQFPEISVSKAGGSLLANVNRWRGNDVGLPPLAAVDLPRVLRYRNLKDATIILIDMAGPGGKKMAMPAFHPPFEQ